MSLPEAVAKEIVGAWLDKEAGANPEQVEVGSLGTYNFSADELLVVQRSSGTLLAR